MFHTKFTWIVSVSCYRQQIFNTASAVPFYPFIVLIQESERLELKNTTKFIARKYFDIFLANRPSIPHQNLILVVITCLRTAVKFSENSDISQQYTIDYAIQQSGETYTTAQFLQCETELLRCMGFQMDLATPQDYMNTLKLIPEQISEQSLNALIDFLLIQPEVRIATSEEIFFSCVLYWCQQRQSDPLNFRVIEAMTQKWDSCRSWASFLEKKVQSSLNDQ